jgi:lipooligosaccharide transport system permease protein
MFAALSMIVTAKSPSYDFFSYYFTLVIAPMFLFSGIFFPIGNLPAWARTLAWFLPLSHGVDASRALFSGRVGWELTGDLTWLAAFTLVAFFFAMKEIRKRLVQ